MNTTKASSMQINATDGEECSTPMDRPTKDNGSKIKDTERECYV